MPDHDLELDEDERQAVAVLAEEAGTAAPRAAHLVRALRGAYAKEGLGVLLGTWPISGSVVDQRIARLDAMLDALPDDEAPPTPFELGAMLRITPSQAGTLLRTYQARYGAKVRARMRAKIATVPYKTSGNNYEFQFSDKPTLDFAADMLRRQGLARGLGADSVKLKLTVPADLTDGQDRNAVALLIGDA